MSRRVPVRQHDGAVLPEALYGNVGRAANKKTINRISRTSMTISLHFGKPDGVERVPCPLTERRLLLPGVAQKLQAPADLMELAGFCRSCLANWYQEAAAANCSAT